MTDVYPYHSPDYLEWSDFPGDRAAIRDLRQERNRQLASDRYQPYRDAIAQVQDLPRTSFDGSHAVVTIGQAGSLTDDQSTDGLQHQRVDGWHFRQTAARSPDSGSGASHSEYVHT